ncbi:hypothetical protein Angca_001459 [Angiostrongylus cantonensis]|nr:hypothetical protein Angca_001459 [Angiostrongylus cantonensis]
MDSLEGILHDRVHNKKWFTARGVTAISKVTGLNADATAKIIGVIILFWLMGQSAWIVCNGIAVVVPLLLTFAFPEERPPVENMRVYWITAFTVSAFDRMLEIFPLYYVAKLFILLFLLVEPSCLNDKLKILLKAAVKSKSSITDEEMESRKLEAVEQSAGSSNPSSSRRGAPISALTPVERTSENNPSGTPSYGAPTPYDTNPPVNLMTAKSGSVDARASFAPAVPVGVGEEENVESTYFSLPKPVGKQIVPSIRLPANQQKSGQRSKVTPLNVAPVPVDERKKISAGLSTYVNLPKY